VVIVATSNQPPDELYKNGLQRERFLPAIKLIKQYMHPLALTGNTDHRLRLLEQADSWHIRSLSSEADLQRSFNDLSTTAAQRNQSIYLNYRKINTVLLSSDVIWFEFDALCGDQRGPADYIELARQYHSVFISDIPQMDDSHNDKVKRFITMIDEFYDRRVKLFASAAATPQATYIGQRLAFEFQRTVSRLLEMRSHDYMQQAHKSS
jgi:cell division protein ZapE